LQEEWNAVVCSKCIAPSFRGILLRPKFQYQDVVTAAAKTFLDTGRQLPAAHTPGAKQWQVDLNRAQEDWETRSSAAKERKKMVRQVQGEGPR